MTTDHDPADLHFQRFCETGDPEALGDVFDQTAGHLSRVAIWLSGNRNDAEDLLQRTFLKAIETRHKFRRGEPVLPWLMGLLGNEARRQRRERDRTAALRPGADQIADPEATVIARELDATVSSIGERIGQPYCDVLQLHLQTGLNCKEIAARLERPAGTVRTQLMRALDLLRQRLPAGFATGMAAALATTPGALANVRRNVLSAAGSAPTSALSTTATNGATIKSLVVAGGALAVALTTLTLWSAAARSAQPVPNVPATQPTVRSSAKASARQDPQRVPVATATRSSLSTEPPRLFHVGAIPANSVALTIDAEGHRAPPGIPTATARELILEVDRRAPWHVVAAVLAELERRGTKTVHFAASLPNGERGTFAVAVPPAAVTEGVVELRLHRERAGVPARSIVPVLRRIVRGHEQMVSQIDWLTPEEKLQRYPEPFAVAINAPADAEFESVLRVAAAANAAAVTSLLFRSTKAVNDDPDSAPTSRPGALAIDLGPRPRITFRPRAMRTEPAERPVDVVGCTTAATANIPKRTDGGAGGRFGSRRPINRILVDENGVEWNPAEHIAAGLRWLAAAQQPDGSLLGTDGRPDLEATALAMLALLANGVRLNSEDDVSATTLNRGIGWLLDQQRDDGCYAEYGPAYLRHHALGTWAVAEAFGMSFDLVVRGSLDDAVAWLAHERQDDGGFSNGVRGAPSDTASSAAVIMALATAEFFRVETPIAAADVAAWFDRDTGDRQAATATDQAAELFSRFFVKQNPKREARLAAITNGLLTATDCNDPWGLVWTSHCLFQAGGKNWPEWRENLAVLAHRQVDSGPDRGSWQLNATACRATTTALCVLTLQSPYRYSRLVR
ncbi:MAG: sigma-70 family RNA polymerase sigma factor [bacterium]|nr:sigma-70 family RNA polymerase sigma factor [bacterium]